ncbi:MAG: hypothetical protein RR420_05385 [Anaerovoracaceae bacterium]
MTNLDILRSVFNDEEIEMILDGRHPYPRPYEDPEEKAMRVEQEERIDRENTWYERMGL